MNQLSQNNNNKKKNEAKEREQKVWCSPRLKAEKRREELRSLLFCFAAKKQGGLKRRRRGWPGINGCIKCRNSESLEINATSAYMCIVGCA